MDKKILIIEDEQAISDILAYNIKKEGYMVNCALNGQDGLNYALEQDYDLILLDVMLPIMDGFEVCSRLRTKKTTPIIMLTAREEEVDKITGLELGADDYITKPFSMKELIARIKANIRRGVIDSEAINNVRQEKIESGGLIIYPDRMEIHKEGKPLELTMREYEILSYLMTNAGKVFSREELLKQVWEYDYLGDMRTVDVAIRRLREKIEDNSAEPKLILTRRGAGYYFAG
jgi:two-component system response regulator VicR